MSDMEPPAGHHLFAGVPYDYASVVSSGSTLFTAGACPLDEAGQVVGVGDHILQARAALANLVAILALHGANADDLVRTTVYVVGEHDDLVRVWQVIADGLRPARPPSTLLGVTSLGYRDQLVEIDGVAALAPIED
jgi:enamine deaminase RidA (YjgF/YER057c/UK114 family)